MPGYSDRINHAFTYLAKHYQPGELGGVAHLRMAHPANVAVILARHQSDETTLVAAILHHLLEAAPPRERPGIEHALSAKFGSVICGVACDVAIPRLDPHGEPCDARFRRREVFRQLATIEPRALDIRCADMIHECGTAIAVGQRLGVEYLDPDGVTSPRETASWYVDVVEAVRRRQDWPSRGMEAELRTLAQRLRALVAAS